MLLGLAVLGYGTSFGMLQVRNNKPTSKSTKSVEVVQMYRSLRDKQKSEILLLKDCGDAYTSISQDNFFTCLPRELRLACCPEGRDLTQKPFVNQRIQNFRWYIKLEDKINLSSTCKPLREILWLDDPCLRHYFQDLQDTNRKPRIWGYESSYERGADAEIGYAIGFPYKVETADNCIIS